MFLGLSHSIFTSILRKVLRMGRGRDGGCQGLGDGRPAAPARKEASTCHMAAKSLGLRVAREQQEMAKILTKISATNIMGPLATSPQNF